MATEPQHVDLKELLNQGGHNTALAFHLMNIDFHTTLIKMEENPEELHMLFDMLTKHAADIAHTLTSAYGANLDVVLPTIIVPRR